MWSHPNGRERRARSLRGFLAALFALALPVGAEHESILIRADRVHVRPGHVLEDARVLVERGRIVAVGPDVTAPEGAHEIAGAVVCAGFLDPWSSFGVDPGAVGDGNTSPATRTVDALDPYVESDRVADVLRAGVTAVRAQAGTEARAGGLGALVRLPLSEQDVLLDDSVVAMRVGTGRAAGDPFGVIDDVDRVVRAISDGDAYLLDWTEYRYELEEWEKAIVEKEAELEKDFKKAKKDREKDIEKAEEKDKEHKDKKYKEDKKPRQPKYDADKAVMARVADGEVPLVVEVHEAAALRELLSATESFGRLRLIVAGGTEALAVADELAERKIPVIVAPTPLGVAERERFDGVDLALCGRLHEKGVRVLIGSGDGANPMATRDLPLMAALAVGHGLDRQAAFEALTIGAARALDVAGRVGTIERGKDADLLILDGEPLGLATRVQYVLSGGRIVIGPEDE